jgi:hypothetical protein
VVSGRVYIEVDGVARAAGEARWSLLSLSFWESVEMHLVDALVCCRRYKSLC